MPTRLVEIGNERRPQLENEALGGYRTKKNNQYSKNHPYVKADGDVTGYGKDPVNIADSENYNKVGDKNDIKARIGNIVDSPGTITQNKYQRYGNQYDQGDVDPFP